MPSITDMVADLLFGNVQATGAVQRPGHPVNFHGDPVSEEQATPEPGVEDVMMPHEYLMAGADAVKLGGAMLEADVGGAVNAARQKLFHQPMLADWYEAQGSKTLADAVRANTPSLPNRVKNAVKAAANHVPESLEDRAFKAEAWRNTKVANKAEAKALGKKLKDAKSTVGEFKSTGSSDATRPGSK